MLDTSINARYQFAKHAGLLMGITYFDANVDIDDDDEVTEVRYGYSGLFLGLHFGF